MFSSFLFRAKSAFTLIELLIVVAIIAILAAIAVPNFLEAQTRAKVSRAKADMRTITTGLESYVIDQNTYPKCNENSWSLTFGSTDPKFLPTLERLTSPIAYLNGQSTFMDPFIASKQYAGGSLNSESDISAVYPAGVPADAPANRIYRYNARNTIASAVWNAAAAPSIPKPTWYLLESCGPDKHYHSIAGGGNTWINQGSANTFGKAIYDATNGTVSRGSIWRVGGSTAGEGDIFRSMIYQTY